MYFRSTPRFQSLTNCKQSAFLRLRATRAHVRIFKPRRVMNNEIHNAGPTKCGAVQLLYQATGEKFIEE